MSARTTLVSTGSHEEVAARNARDRLIVALDFPTREVALDAVDRIEGQCRWFKVGPELYLSAGNPIIETLRQRGFSVFLDLKFHDIPNTVAGTVRSAARLGADLLTVHAGGGPEMLRAAAEAAASSPEPPRLLAVTVLTSMDQEQLSATGIAVSPSAHALSLAKLAHSCGISGLVCSPAEAAAIRSALRDVLLVIPGIRPAGSSAADQKRFATPAAALRAGADYLVVGRPITHASDPAAAVHSILDEMNAAG